MDGEKINKIVDELTLEEKASLASGKDFWQSQEIARLNIPSIYFADGPHGLRKQEAAADHLGLNESVKSTCFPTAVTLASSWSQELCEEVGCALGKEASALGVGVLLGPGVNIKRSPLCGRNFEYYSEDPYLAGKCGSALIKGVQTYAAAACAKHYACNNQETGRMYSDSIVDERTLREIYLMPFEMAVKEGGVRTVMSAYNRLNGEYANENPYLMVDVLRKEWGFQGVVVTDWGGCNSRVAGARCGNEIEMPTTGGESNEELVRAVQEGELSEKRLNENVARLISLAFDAQKVVERAEKKVDVQAHHALARRAAAESCVLLKNDGALPLKGEERVCFLGEFVQRPRYQGGGSSFVNPTKLDSVFEGLQTEKGFVFAGYERGFFQYGRNSRRLIKRAVKLLQACEKAVLFLGLDDITESEGKDRKNLRLPANQIELLSALQKTGKPIVVVLSCGAPVETEWDSKVNALLCTYLCGQAGAGAILDLLTGRKNPSGKLAETFPVRLEDTPPYPYYLKKPLTAEYREGLFVGYRFYDKLKLAPKYPFGFGLSYTRFSYSNMEVDESGVSFTLKNVGEREGAEVVQLYVGAIKSRIFRAERELKGFRKIFLRAGEETFVHLPFDEYTFRWYNPTHRRWEIEDCEYEVSVGSSSRDLRLCAHYFAGGEAAIVHYDKHALAPYYTGEIKFIPKQTFEALLGRKLPEGGLPFVKKNRILVNENTPIMHLKYARGWLGRAFACSITFAEKFLRFFGKHKLANTLRIGPYDMPVRGLSRLTGGKISMGQVEGLIMAFNGKFFVGLKRFFQRDRKKGEKKKRTE